MKEFAPLIAWGVALTIFAFNTPLGLVAIVAIIAYGFGQSLGKDH
jgi:hypothetical protein